MSPITCNKTLTIFVLIAVLMSGCSPQIEDAVSLDYQPIYPMASDVSGKLPDGSIYSTQAGLVCHR